MFAANSRNVEEIVIPQGKRREIKTSKMEHDIISKLLNDSAVSKCVTKKWIEENNLSGCQYSVIKNIR